MSGEKIFIIGGGTSGISAANRIRRLNENCEITIIDQQEHIGYPVSALPLYISNKITKKEVILSDYENKLTKIYNILVLKKHEVTKIDRIQKKLFIKSLNDDTVIEKDYDKIVIASGSKLNIPKIYGTNADNFFKFSDLSDAIAIKNYIEKFNPKIITIIGLNQVSLNLANELLSCGFLINIVESSSKLLTDFDEEFNFMLKEEFAKSGVKIFLSNDYLKFVKNDTNSIHSLEITKYNIDTQLVIYCDRIIPNSLMAKNSGIDVGVNDGILIDENMRTNDKDIFACGDVAETINLISKDREIFHTLNVSEIQGRIAGSNVAGFEVSYKGMVKTVFYLFNNLKMGITGLNLSQAKNVGYDASSITIYNGNYERFVSGSTKLHIKTVFDNNTKKILGAQVCGKGEGVDKRIDVFATAIYAGLTVSDLAVIDFSYHSEISVYKEAINVSGMVSENKINHISDSIAMKEINYNEDFVILDIRNKSEYQKEHLLNSIWIPLSDLRDRVGELPKNKKIYVYGHVGLRGYVAERILKGNGFRDVCNIDGGITSIKILENID
ncbi:MAG TPA: FAD-dependent oxidoreductase [Spirochaetota bacterium]|nr:FAD-dependent oxidoreductase [Spirochaetota bacterium]